MGFDWNDIKTQHKWLKDNTIYLSRYGSYAYGTNIETSDEDYRGIAIAPIEYYLGNENKFEQQECNKPDVTIFDVRKFFKLACENNPNILEILFVSEEDRIIVTDIGQEIIDCRTMFPSRKCLYTYSGYANSQLGRIRRHKRWLDSGPQNPPTRKEMGLPEKPEIPKEQYEAISAGIQKQIDEWSLKFLDNVEPSTRILLQDKLVEHLTEIGIASNDDLWPAAARVIGLNDNIIEIMKKERAYVAAKREWENYLTWKKERNPIRAEMESKFGYDCKHASHLVRLLKMCKEIIQLGKVIVKRPDAEELLSIRRGEWTYEQLVEWSENQYKELKELVKTSPLPEEPDYNHVDKVLTNVIMRMYTYGNE